MTVQWTRWSQNRNVQSQIDTCFKSLDLAEDKLYWIEHVKGHQERENLNQQDELNNIADSLATPAQQSITWKQHNTSQPIYTAGKIVVIINHQLITHNIDRELQQAYTAINLRLYLEGKFHWKSNITDLINWELQGSNLTSCLHMPML
eukprot:9175407-Ditylum_brightwellii.AAC.1